MINFNFKPGNELEKEGRDNIPAPEDEIVCPNCHRTLKKDDILPYKTCSCGYHFRIGARTRLSYTVDSFSELFSEMRASDPLRFPGYSEKKAKAEKTSGEKESVITGEAVIDSARCALFVMDPFYMMGSMGSVTGEKITRLFEYAADNSLPVIGFTASGGARMQEGLLSLMQMAKTSAAVKRHSDKGLLYITVLTDPTTGGVTASFAMQGDIILAEPHALVGFAGKRVIEQTIHQRVPEDLQAAETVLKEGFVDAIVPRAKQKETIAFLLATNQKGGLTNG